MSTTFRFHTTVPSDGTITLPPEFRGAPVRIAVEKESTQPSTEDGEYSINDFLKKYTGILKDCDIESVEAMKEDRRNYILEKYK
jgi:hypothetical protein